MSAVGAVFTGRLLIFILGGLITPLLTRLLGPSAYGQYATALAIFGMVKILMVSGIDVGAKKYFSEDRSLQNWKEYVWASYVQLSLLLGGGFALGLVVLSLSGAISFLLGKSYRPLFYLLAVLALFTQFRTLSLSTLMGLHLEKYSEPIKTLEKIIFGVIAVGLAALGYDVSGVIFGHIFSVVVTLLICLLIVQNHFDLTQFTKRIPKKFPKKELWWFSHTSVIYVFLLSSLYHVDVILLQIFTTEEAVGYYKAALVIVGLLWLFPQSVQQSLIQSVAELWQSESVSKINKLSAKTTRYVFLLTSLLAVGVAVLADSFVPLYFGESYSPAVTPLLLLLPGTICFAIARPSLAITNAKGNMRPLIIATGTGAAINLLLNLLLIPEYKLMGAAVATTLGYTSLLLTQILCAWYVGYNPISGTRPIRVLVTGLATGLILYGVAEYLSNSLYKLIVIPPLGGILFALIALGSGAVSIDELRTTWTKFSQDTYLK
ncbi:oligosaccharide flippase family protein [Natrinema sp. HArc-T2]|uniref:oligosaccharide flippase family protein n=1 Tax=Natrinema sp. HArc-T2 TaxID=3242701 RepID=UPI00359EBDBF